MHRESIIQATKNWIREVVIGCNFCPFAAREFRKDSIAYIVINEEGLDDSLAELANAFNLLNIDATIETILLIIPQGFESFAEYLDLVEAGELELENAGYEGVYQLASFHPDYLFAGADPNDAANYTNRSPYPMLHLLREASVTKAIDSYPNTGLIPEKNIAYAQKKGLAYMQALRMACMSNLE